LLVLAGANSAASPTGAAEALLFPPFRRTVTVARMPVPLVNESTSSAEAFRVANDRLFQFDGPLLPFASM